MRAGATDYLETGPDRRCRRCESTTMRPARRASAAYRKDASTPDFLMEMGLRPFRSAGSGAAGAGPVLIEG
jgi:hypothetical protein